MPDPDRDPLELDDKEPTRLCIVSHDPVLCGPFVAALQTVLSPHDEFEIIRDRRRDRSSTDAKRDVADQPSVDRRRHPHVDRLLTMDGFAIVPATAPVKRHRLSVLPTAATSEALSGYDADADERERLESVRSFKRRRTLRLVSWLVLAGLLGAGAVLLLYSPAAKTLMTWARSEAPSASQPPSGNRIDAPPAVVQAPPVTESSPVIGPQSIRENNLPNVRTPALPSVAVSKSPEPAQPLQAHTSPPAVPEAIASVPRVSDVQPPAAASPEVAPPGFVDLPRVELLPSSVAAREGQGEVYAVRISDTGGQPLAGADVLLFARMEDGTVENIPLGPGTEPGTYHGTAPPARSAPVDLRIRVTKSDRRVELPLAP
jgi:hypothetical protein